MEPPIFIVGTMRSGTTLVRLILDTHQRLAIANESGFMRAVAAAKAIPDQHEGDGWYRRFGVSDDDMNERLRSFYDGIFTSWAQSQGKARWGDKTPFHVSHIPLINEVFPEAAIVGVVRHPGAVVASQLRRGRDFATSLRSWRAQNVRLLKAAAHRRVRPRLAVVRYEDLVTEPEPTLRELLAFLGEEWSPELLRHHEVHRDRGTPRLAEGGTRTLDAIDASRRTRWIDELDSEQRRQLNVATAGLSRVFSYDETDALPIGAPRLLRGRDLVARRRTVPKASFSRDLLPPPAPVARKSGAPYVLAQLMQLGRSDAAYLVRRAPLAARTAIRRLRATDDD